LTPPVRGHLLRDDPARVDQEDEMPGHRRDHEPDDTTRLHETVPTAGPGGDVHGSTAVGGTAVGGPAAGAHPAAGQDPSAGQSPPARSADRPTVVQPAATGSDHTAVLPTIPAAPAAGPVTGPGTPGSAAPTGPDTDRHPASTAGRKEVVAAQRARYGGISWGSAFFGWLSANGFAVLLLALLSALGVAFGLTAGVQDAQSATDQAATGLGLGAGIALLVALFLAYLAGGYVAGRMARFDGAKQGVAVWVIGLLVVLLLALAGLVFGSQYNVLSRLDLPRIPIDEGTATTAGIIALVAVLVVTLVAAVLGGLMGVRYHRRVDRVGFDH
jgi:hypothetical protein